MLSHLHPVKQSSAVSIFAVGAGVIGHRVCDKDSSPVDQKIRLVHNLLRNIPADPPQLDQSQHTVWFGLRTMRRSVRQRSGAGV